MKEYLHNHFDQAKLMDVFDELPLWSAPFGLKLLDYIDYKQAISALDIGYGSGFPLTEVAMRLGADSKVYGIDPWQEAISRTKKKLDYYGISNTTLLEGYAECIPLADDSLDLIVSNNGINNVQNIDAVIKECARLMKSGGQFLQTMNLDGSMFEFYAELEAVFVELGMDDRVEDIHGHIAAKRPSVAGIQKLIEQNGFMIKDIEYDQFDYRFASGTALFNHYFIRLAFMQSWIGLIPEARVEDVFDRVERRLNVHASRLGCIKLSIPYVLINAVKV